MAQAIRDELIEELLQGYSSPQDLLGENDARMVRYVSQQGRATGMQVAEDREAAVTAAWALLDRGIDVTEVTPASGPRTHRLDAMAVREIHHFREYATARSS